MYCLCSLCLLITFHSVCKTTTLLLPSACVCKHCSLWQASSETSLIPTAIATELHPSHFESCFQAFTGLILNPLRGPSLVSRPSPLLCLVTSSMQTQRRERAWESSSCAEPSGRQRVDIPLCIYTLEVVKYQGWCEDLETKLKINDMLFKFGDSDVLGLGCTYPTHSCSAS